MTQPRRRRDDAPPARGRIRRDAPPPPRAPRADPDDGVIVLAGRHAESFIERMFGGLDDDEDQGDEPDDDDEDQADGPDDDDEDQADEPDPEPEQSTHRFYRRRR